MTIKDKILSLYDGKRSTTEIAESVGTSVEYVRVVARQRKGGSYSDIDRRYRASRLGKLAEYRKRPAHAAYLRALRATGNYAAARLAYKQAREAVHA